MFITVAAELITYEHRFLMFFWGRQETAIRKKSVEMW